MSLGGMHSIKDFSWALAFSPAERLYHQQRGIVATSPTAWTSGL